MHLIFNSGFPAHHEWERLQIDTYLAWFRQAHVFVIDEQHSFAAVRRRFNEGCVVGVVAEARIGAGQRVAPQCDDVVGEFGREHEGVAVAGLNRRKGRRPRNRTLIAGKRAKHGAGQYGARKPCAEKLQEGTPVAPMGHARSIVRDR